MKLMFDFEGTFEEYCEIVKDYEYYSEPGIEFYHSKQWFTTPERVSHDLTFSPANVAHGDNIGGGCYIDSHKDVASQMRTFRDRLAALVGRSIHTLFYHSASSYVGSVDSDDYVRRTGDSRFEKLKGWV